MTILDSLLGGQNSGALMQLANRFGLNTGQVQSVIGQLAPALSSGVVNHAEQNGLSSLLGMLQSGNHQQYAQDPQQLQQPQAIEAGNGILEKLFGTKDVSRTVAETASQKTGVGSDIIKKMLPVVAILAMTALHKKTQEVDPHAVQSGSPATGLLGQLTGFLGGGQHNSIADDVLGMLRRAV